MLGGGGGGMNKVNLNHNEFLWFQSNGDLFLKFLKMLVAEPNPSSIFPFVLVTR